MTNGVALSFSNIENAAQPKQRKPGFFLRFIRALQEAQMRSAERKVQQYLRYRVWL